MDMGNIPIGCRGCDHILPYIQDIERLEAQQITPEIREKLIDERGIEPETVDWFAAENEFDLEQSRKALDEASVRTIGCAGLRSIQINPEVQSGAGSVLICQSPFESVSSPEE